jgi:phage host-nuclease inhibitor protein Gam
MPPVRRKAPRQLAPQTIEEATGLLGRYVGILTETERLRADADVAISTIEAARDGAIAPMEEEAKDLFLRLRAWWGVAGDTLTEGKRRSTELAGCLLGVRTTPPSLSIGKMKVADAIAKLADTLPGFLRTKMELDKPALLKVLAGEYPGDLIELGFSIRQKDEFFIDRAAPKPASPEDVAIPEAAE